MVFILPNMTATAFECRNIEKESGKLSVVSISRIHKSKNLLYALKTLTALKGNIVFDIYGPVEDVNYWHECLDFISKMPSNISVNYKGAVKVGESVKTFAQYHCFLFPTISENYSQAIAESILAGTPIVISQGTTPWDDVHENGGFAIELENKSGFADTLQMLCDMNSDDYNGNCDKLQKYRERKLNSDELHFKYINMFTNVIRIDTEGK